MRRRAALPVLLAWTLSVVSSGESLAAWPYDPVNGNVPIATGSAQQRYPSILADGAGGAFIAWHDSRNGGANYDIFVQRIDADGVPMWTANGVAACSAPFDQANTALVSDGAGGVIVAWHDIRSGPSWDIYAQRLNGAGVPQWTANGVALCALAGNQINPVIVTDGYGGAIVVWSDFRNGNEDIFIQRISAGGVPVWTANGIAVCTASGPQSVPDMMPDYYGGAYVVWRDGRNAFPYDGAIFGMGIYYDGTLLASTNGQLYDQGHATAVPKIVPDLSSGYGYGIMTWHQVQSGSHNILAQKIDIGGGMKWNNGNMVVVCGAAGDQMYPSIAPDGQGGAFIVWKDLRADAGDIYAQRLITGGSKLWPTEVAMCTASGTQSDPIVVYDGVSSSIVTWSDSRSGFTDVYAQAVTASGGWGGNGVPVSIAAVDQLLPRPVVGKDGSAIVTWFDTRNGYDNDVYAQRVGRHGELGAAEPVIVDVRDVPNDQGGRVQVEWTASYLDAAPDLAIDGYSVWRRVPNPAPQAALAGDARFRRMAPVLGATAVYWEYLTTLPARGFPGYSWVAPTTSDQLPGSNPYTSFMVLAEKDGGYPYWSSAPDSGYSIDNLAPPAPAPFTGTFSSGGTALHWGVSPAADFAEYRLHRGSSAGFVPGPGNLVATAPDTGYVDGDGTASSYYKLSAVDIHGNESEFALLTPSGTVSTENGDPRIALRLASPQPNPALSSTRVAFDLPSATPVSLRVFDATGRVVRTLFQGVHEAGRFSLPWDLRDDSGTRVPNGIYFVRLEANGQRYSRRVVAMR
jgi:hypothetical protein